MFFDFDALEKKIDEVEQSGKSTQTASTGTHAPSNASVAEDRTSTPTKFVPGQHIRVVGLVAKQELNDRQGVLVAFSESKGRWQVRLSGAGAELMLFKPSNLQSCEAAGRRQLPTEPVSPEEAVEWVNGATDEFEMLILPLSLEEDLTKIRRQYKRLSLLVHPDKNPHPEAGAAFRKLFGAMRRLTDPVQQRLALRRARQEGAGVDGGEDQWWQQATVDEMERSFRDTEQKLHRMGLFEPGKNSFGKASGVSEDDLWLFPEYAKGLCDKDLALFLDARDSSDFSQSHIRGALSLPGHTPEQLAGLPKTSGFQAVVANPEQSVVVYSDNGSMMSRCVHVARALRLQKGVAAGRVFRLTGGLNAWKRLGFPVEGEARPLFAGRVLGTSMHRLGADHVG